MTPGSQKRYAVIKLASVLFVPPKGEDHELSGVFLLF